MAGGVRKWDVYVLDDMGCSPETMDVFWIPMIKTGTLIRIWGCGWTIASYWGSIRFLREPRCR